MLFSTETSLYKVLIINGGKYRVKRVVVLSGHHDVVPGATFEGDRVEFNENGHLVLYNGNEKILETTHITNL